MPGSAGPIDGRLSVAKTRELRSGEATIAAVAVGVGKPVVVAVNRGTSDGVAVALASTIAVVVGVIVRVDVTVGVGVQDAVGDGVGDGVSVGVGVGVSVGSCVGVDDRRGAAGTVTWATGSRDDGGALAACCHAGRTGVATAKDMTPPRVGDATGWADVALTPASWSFSSKTSSGAVAASSMSEGIWLEASSTGACTFGSSLHDSCSVCSAGMGSLFSD